MKPTRLFLLAVFAVLVLLGSTVMADSDPMSSSGSKPLMKEKDIEAAKAKYLKEKLAMEKKLLDEKAKAYKKYFSDSDSDSDDDEKKLLDLLSERIPAEKLEKIMDLDAETRTKVLAELKLNFNTVLLKKSEFDAKRTALSARLAEIESANEETDDSARLIAKLRLANQLCERIEANSEESCRAILSKFTAVRDKTRLTEDEMDEVEDQLKETRVVWVQKHYSRWLEQAEKLQSKLQRIENKLVALVGRAKGANLENADNLEALQQKFARIHSAYDSKLEALKAAYVAFNEAPSYRGALEVRAAAAELKVFGKVAVHSVNRFVYLYHHMGASDSDDGITITPAEAREVVDEIPSVAEIELQADAEVAATVATADVPAAELVRVSGSVETDDSGMDSPSDLDGSDEDESDDDSPDDDSDDDSDDTDDEEDGQ